MKRLKSLAIIAGYVILALAFTNCSKDDTNPVYSSAPTLSTSAVTSITETSAISGGTISSDGGATVTAKGVVWSTSHNPTTADSKITSSSSTNVFIIPIIGLTSNTTYYVRAYGTNSAGTGYGAEQTFTTLNTSTTVVIPTLTTAAIGGISASAATGGGTISSDGGGAITARGVVWSIAANPTLANSKTTNGTGTGAFTSSLTGLSASTTYHVRAYATNSAGTAYGNDISFTTSASATTTVTISIAGFAFSPSGKTVTAGTIVKWINNDATTHTVTSDDGTTFNSGNIAPGGNFSYTASTTGTFNYHCEIHGSMTGTLTVTP